MSETTEISMPRLSDSMEEGTILKWLIADGHPVQAGEELLDIETDKASMTVNAELDGTLEIIAAEGSTLPVGAPIARIGPVAATSERGDSGDGAPVAPAAPVAPVAPPMPAAPAGFATPLARRTARVHDISLAQLIGTGLHGRITRADVLRAAGLEVPATPAADHSGPVGEREGPGAADPLPGSSLAPLQSTGDQTRRVQPTRLQQLIARRMTEAKSTIPDFQVQTEVAMDAAIRLRSDLKALSDGQPVPSFNDIIVKACGMALRWHPRANASYIDGGFELHGQINIGIAVAAEDALVVPVVRDVNGKSLGRIADETRRLADRVRTGAVTPPELEGATFTVSNLGMYGMTAITPVINPPQVAILGVGGTRGTLARVGGEIVDRALMTLTLSCDHRILYGADAARLLADIKSLIEAPLRVML